MAIISKTNTFSAGTTIVASEHNANFDVIYNDYNGNITNANLASSAGIVDTKLAQITTASKVHGSSLTGLASVPSGGGAVPLKNGGTGQDLSTNNQGDVYYDGGTNGFTRLVPGTSGQVLKTSGASANPSWANALASVSDYGTSASSSTSRQATAIKIAFGSDVSVTGAGSAAVTNLPFTGASSYTVIVSASSSFGTPPAGTDQSSGNLVANQDSGAQFTIYNTDDQTKTVNWLAIGI